MKVLSLFDGMSCGQIALKQLGIKVDTYYSSEIDKYAMQITQKNFPNTIQVGDICNLDPKDFMDVDLIQAGSPCQGFSFAGKQLAFDDPRSALFFEFIRLLKAIKPKYFLLENVRMKKEFLEVITEQVSSCYTADDVAPEFKDMFGNVKFEPHFINASLVSAQSRQRYYWTNIPGVKQPEDRGIVLRDILETEPESITKMSDKFVKRNGDKNCMIDQDKEKAHNLSAEEYVKNGRQGNYLACDQSGKPTNKPKKVGNIYPSGGQNGNVYSDKGKSPTLSSGEGIKGRGVGSNNAPKIETKPKQVGIATDINGHDILKRVYSPDGKSPTVTTCGGGNTEPKVVVSRKRHEIIEKNLGDRIDDDTLLIGSSQKNAYLGKDKSSSLTESMGKGGGHVPMVRGAAFRGRAFDKDGKRLGTKGDSIAGKSKQMLELRKDKKSNAITTVGKDSVVASKIREKSKTVRSGGRGSYDRHEWDSVDELHWRKLTPLECERLQTVPDNYTEGVSNTQRYRMLGNGWCVAVIEHIYQNMEHDD